ncbi:hypothetical protein [Streptomyces sp. Caat 7-52]|uniref:hypothetical protein n=1 Tax=Streptomyces sp. Caat 7-52 TaxID=2949637 RepID=UPI0020352B9F|nr:hypothetical protein [Streptomyces sp. Caat 7-52]
MPPSYDVAVAGVGAPVSAAAVTAHRRPTGSTAHPTALSDAVRLAAAPARGARP